MSTVFYLVMVVSFGNTFETVWEPQADKKTCETQLAKLKELFPSAIQGKRLGADCFEVDR
jgi:uncharacterized protein YktA (UPF0223 family)